MSHPHDLGEKDIPFLLEQLEFQSQSLSEAERTISHLQRTVGNALTADGNDEADLEIETLQERITMTEEGMSFFFGEYTRLKRELEIHHIADPEHALIRAAEHGRVNIVELLLESGADVDVRDHTKGTALIAACYNGHTSTVLELIKNHAKLDLQDEGGHTALVFACDKGHMDICTALVNANAAINTQDHRGNTGLIMAAYNGHIDVCHFLVQRGVQVNARNEDGRTALMMSCYPAEAETRYFNAKLDICELLIGAGADVNATNLSLNTALHIAFKNSSLEACAMLLRAGADPSARNSDGLLPADVAGDDRTRELLLTHLASYPPLPSNVTTSPPPSPKKKSGSINMLKNVFKMGKSKDKDKDRDDSDVAGDHIHVHNLYGSSDRINDRRHSGDSSSRQRYAFVHENSLASRQETRPGDRVEKRTSPLKLGALSTNAVNSTTTKKKMSVGEHNALNFRGIAHRNSLEERSSTGNIAAPSRDSMAEARERRRRQSSGASGDMARQLQRLRRVSSGAAGADSDSRHHVPSL